MIDEPPVECFHTGRPARQNGNTGKNTIPILGLGSRTPNLPNAPMPGDSFAQEPTPNALQSEDQVSAASCRLSVARRENKGTAKEKREKS